MAGDRDDGGAVEFPNELEIVLTRDFPAPMELVHEVLWKPEHVRKTIAPFDELVKVCTIELYAGGSYHYVFVTDDGTECSFRGTFLEVDPPARVVNTWHFDGWPDVEAVETISLRETDGNTRLTWTLAFADQAGRDHWTSSDGIKANFDKVAELVSALLSERSPGADRVADHKPRTASD